MLKKQPHKSDDSMPLEDVPSRFGALLDAGIDHRHQHKGQFPTLADSAHAPSTGRERLWRGFMGARIFVAAVLLSLFGFLQYLGYQTQTLSLAITVCYLVLTVLMLWMGSRRFSIGAASSSQKHFDPHWLLTVGVDIVVFAWLMFLQAGAINYTALFALPVLQAATLGSLLLALGTAAIVTIALLIEVLQYSLYAYGDNSARYAQAALTSSGLFVIAYLAHQLAARLAREERVSLGSEMAARTQIQVNQLVIDSMTDGVLVIDINGIVHAANPSAIDILDPQIKPPFVLASRPIWQPLADLAAQSMSLNQSLTTDISLHDGFHAIRQLHIKTQLSLPYAYSSAISSTVQPVLCVMFMEDWRELEARLRTEKLAAMGRMSAAVAHEIRNPLSAISQANGLLAEETDPASAKHLVNMIAQNVHRISRVVDDVLDVSRAESTPGEAAHLHDASQQLFAICKDWAQTRQAEEKMDVRLPHAALSVQFDAEHLRRVLVNLLDNALRHARGQRNSICVSLKTSSTQAILSVWSDGAVIEQSVEKHLFEPFFSSQSRSSGLGLFICRELCTRHQAQIAYARAANEGSSILGNNFYVTMRILATPS